MGANVEQMGWQGKDHTILSPKTKLCSITLKSCFYFSVPVIAETKKTWPEKAFMLLGHEDIATSCPQKDESEVDGKRKGVKTWPLKLI